MRLGRKPEFTKKSFEETESVLHERWDAQAGSGARASWVDSKEAVRESWDRERGKTRKP